jgi:hypothetical protein
MPGAVADPGWAPGGGDHCWAPWGGEDCWAPGGGEDCWWVVGTGGGAAGGEAAPSSEVRDAPVERKESERGIFDWL